MYTIIYIVVKNHTILRLHFAREPMPLASVFVQVHVRIEFFRTDRAYAVAEGRLGMLLDIGLDLLPISLVIADALLPPECFHFGKGLAKLADHLITFFFRLLAAFDLLLGQGQLHPDFRNLL